MLAAVESARKSFSPTNKQALVKAIEAYKDESFLKISGISWQSVSRIIPPKVATNVDKIATMMMGYPSLCVDCAVVIEKNAMPIASGKISQWRCTGNGFFIDNIIKIINKKNGNSDRDIQYTGWLSRMMSRKVPPPNAVKHAII